MSKQQIPKGSQTPSPKRIKYDGASSNQPGRSKKKMPNRNNIDFTNLFKRLYFVLCKNYANTGLPNLLTGTGHIYGRKVIAGYMHFCQE